MNIREYLKQHPKALAFVAALYNMIHHNNLWRCAKGNTVVCEGAFLNHTYIHINGKGCKVIIEPMARLRNSVITLSGNGCTFRLGGGTYHCVQHIPCH